MNLFDPNIVWITLTRHPRSEVICSDPWKLFESFLLIYSNNLCLNGDCPWQIIYLSKHHKIPTPQIFHQNSLNIQNKKLAVSLILREFEWKFASNLIELRIFSFLIYNFVIYISKCFSTSCPLLPECYLLVFRIENTVDGWDISYSKMPSLSMLAGLSRHEAKFPGNIFLLIKKMKIFRNCWNWKIQIDVCSANYQFEEIWNIVLRQKTLET